MNICFFIGKIISDIQFEFIINNKNISIAIFNIKLRNKSIITIKVYNDLADYCYRKLKQGMHVLIYGYINNKCEMILEYIEII